MNAKMLTPSRYFSAADFEGEVTVTIKAVRLEEIEVEAKGGKPATTETKGSIELAEYPKAWISNVTNTKCLAAMFGDESVETRWPGKRVTLCIERVMSFGEWVPGVRIKGSPDIDKPISLKLKLRKKKDQVLTMQRTGLPVQRASAGKAPAPITTVTFGKNEPWYSKPIASLDADTLDLAIKSGEGMVATHPAEKWVPSVRACIAAIRSDLDRRLHAEPPPSEPAMPEVEAP